VANTTTLTDLINRTYHLGFTYQKPIFAPYDRIGRLFLPWAPSLSTIDGGYLGRKITRIATVGFFAGSTPDPSSWSYNTNQRIAGTFVNFEAGDFDHTRSLQYCWHRRYQHSMEGGPSIRILRE